MSGISPIAEIIDEARNGRPFILVDADDRELALGQERGLDAQPADRPAELQPFQALDPVRTRRTLASGFDDGLFELGRQRGGGGSYW